MASEGTITIGGKQYTWTSPTIADIVEFEGTTKLSLMDSATFNGARGRAYLAALCLKRHHPELTPGVILGWPAERLVQLWALIAQAIPIFSSGPRPPAEAPATDEAAGERGEEKQEGEATGPTSTSQPSRGSTDGSRAGPDESA